MDWVDVVRRVVPPRVRFAVQRVVSLGAVKQRYFARRNPLTRVTESDENRFGALVRIGIIHNREQRHTHFVAACLELGVPFRVIDISVPDWVERVERAACDEYLVWPDATATNFASLIKDRCDLLEHGLGKSVLPASHERWMYEDKIRLYDWLRVHAVPHPRTWIFFSRPIAEEFAATCELPIVFKTSFGAAATGVRILKTRRALRSLIARAFGRGIQPDGYHRRDRQWGSIILQEYIDIVKEWRLVRIGDAYFGHPKGRSGSFHSGSGKVEWDAPQAHHLDFLHKVTEAGEFRSMNVDAFETSDQRLLVNELQTVFGASASVDQLRVEGVIGRMLRDPDGAWRFEAGDFARNACANARVIDVLGRHGS